MISKNKKIYIGIGIAAVGLAAYFFFFRNKGGVAQKGQSESKRKEDCEKKGGKLIDVQCIKAPCPSVCTKW